MTLVILFLFGYAVNLDVEGVALGVYDEDRTSASRELVDRFAPTPLALAIVREKETGTIQQIFASSVTSAEFIVGKLLPYALVAFLQMPTVIAIGRLWFEVPVRGGLGP